ncbi:MAG TPA: hypothetical protein VMR34_06280 [Candidatus Saccharimonadales bacterium]|nr:hypothetical protein [Candidatus Saccharimonadales bacterium]
MSSYENSTPSQGEARVAEPQAQLLPGFNELRFLMPIMAGETSELPFTVTKLKETEITLKTPIEGQTGEDYELFAALMIPSQKDDHEYTYLKIGRHPRYGFFIAGESTDTGQLEIEDEQDHPLNRRQSPLIVGDTMPTRVILGRPNSDLKVSGITVVHPVGVGGDREGAIHDPGTLMYAGVVEGFGPKTSRKHVVIDFGADGVKIIDTSRYGTVVMHTKPVY